MGEEPACNAGDAGDLGSVLGLGRFLGEQNGNPLPYSCLENPMYGGTWQATVHRVVKSQTQLKQLSTCSTLILYSFNKCMPAYHVPGPVVSEVT